MHEPLRHRPEKPQAEETEPLKQSDHETYQKPETSSSAAEFFELPWEIRRHILLDYIASLYPRLIIGRGQAWPRDSPTWPSNRYCKKFSYCEDRPPHAWTYHCGDSDPEPGALRVCKQLRQELLDALLSNRPLFCENIWGYGTKLLPKWYKENIEIVCMGYLKPTFNQKETLESLPTPTSSWWNGKEWAQFKDNASRSYRQYDFVTSPAHLRQFPKLRELRLRWIDIDIVKAQTEHSKWRDFAGCQWIEKQVHASLSSKLERIRRKSNFPHETCKLVGERVYHVRCRHRTWDHKAEIYRNTRREHEPGIVRLRSPCAPMIY